MPTAPARGQETPSSSKGPTPQLTTVVTSTARRPGETGAKTGSSSRWILNTSALRGDMPLYEYECDACHHRFEVIQKYSDPLIDACPKCGSSVQKLLSSPAIQFKGSGFYITDYARAGKSDSGQPSSRGDG